MNGLQLLGVLPAREDNIEHAEGEIEESQKLNEMFKIGHGQVADIK